MGANSSDPNKNKQVAGILAQEIRMYKTGQMLNSTVRFQLFVMCATQVTAFRRFYQELSVQQIMDYFRAVQVFDCNEVIAIVQEIIEKVNNVNDADTILRQFLQIIVCPYKKSRKDDISFISPCCCKELYKDIIKKNYKVSWGKYSPGVLFDFKSPQMTEMRRNQESHVFKPQFRHSGDTCLVIFDNPLEKIYNQPINFDERPLNFEKTPSKPMIWEKNIHTAATKGSVKSLQYDIYLLPLLRDLQNETGNTPTHLTAISGENDALIALKNMNADFNIYNNNGNLPIHVVKTNACLDTLISAGCYLGALNKNGQTIIETQSNPFNKEIIEGLFNRGVNILIPNQRGLYWMQYVIKRDYYPAKKNNYVEFQKFVRKILKKSQNPYYQSNTCLQQILSRDVDTSERDDAEDLRNAVISRDMNQIITYLGMGAHGDTKNDSGFTNLMMCAERGDLELAQILANNYCDPNQTNNNGENSFWIAAWNRHYDVATILQKTYYADPDILSKSGQTLLHIAYAQSIQELFYYLLNTGASPNVPNSEHETVQFIAFLKRDDTVAEMIQDKYDGDINAKGKLGNTLGHLCILQHDNQRLEYILGRKLNIETKNDLGYSLFMCAIVSIDDLDLCQNLLGRGANINTQDAKGETPFYYICKDDKFCRQKFDFLLDHNCDFNIQDNARDFPISRLINKDRNEEALILLGKKANIIDPDSPTEPVCIAIMNHSKYWLDTLIEHGANAKNKKYPIIENYINRDFFNFETLKKMRPLNSAIGAPIQAAIKHHMIDIAHFLWDEADEHDRAAISRSLDDEHRIPLSTAINACDQYLVDKLIRKNYDLTTSDNIRRTPFMYACISNNSNWMYSIEQLISLNDLDAVDSQGNSALTFVAVNGQQQIADHLFIRGVSVKRINKDNRGIIQRYVWLIDRYNDIRTRAEENQSRARKLVSAANDHIDKSKKKIDDIGRNLDELRRKQDFEAQGSNGNPRQYDGQIRKLEDDLNQERGHFDHLQRMKGMADEHYRIYTHNLSEIQNASRETILYHLDHLGHISQYSEPPIRF